MTHTKHFTPALLIVGVLVVFALTYVALRVSAAPITPPQPSGYTNVTLLSATTTTATSTNVTGGGGYAVIQGAKAVTVYLSHGGLATTTVGTSTFTVQVSPDLVNWYDFGKLAEATSTNYETRPSLYQATSSKALSMDLANGGFYALRCIAVEVAGGTGEDGEHTCKVGITY